MTKKTFLCYALLGLSSFFCLGDNRIFAQPSTPNPYEGCCGVEPVVFAVGVGSVYVPNVITSNSDAINDVFYPSINNKINSITSFKIIEAATGTVLFEKPSLTVADASMQYEVLTDGWDGKNSLGEPFRGLFKYSMTVIDVQGTSVDIQGSACSVVCDVDATLLLDNKNCLFPVQHDQNGGVDATLPNYEKKCFSSN